MSAFKILLAVTLLLIAVVAVVLGLRARQKKLAKAAAPEAPGGPSPVAEVIAALSKGRAQLLAKVPTADARAQMPRYLFLGEAGAGKTALLGGSGLSIPLGDTEPAPGDRSACNVWLLGKALVVEVAGRLLFTDEGRPAKEDAFKTVLSSMRSGRPERPIDGVLIAVPCVELAPDAEGRASERKRKAAVLRSAIVLAQQALGMNVPIYVIVTQSDRLAGFRSLGEEIPSAMRDDMLGWSSPYESFSERSEDWIDEAIETIRSGLVRYQARRFATPTAVKNPDDFFLFPAEISSLGDGLRDYLDSIFIEGAGQDPLSLRGIYFCGAAASPGAARALPAPQVAASSVPPWIAPQPSAALALADKGAPDLRKILFARELFEKKILGEQNLGSPAAAAVKRCNNIILAMQIAAACLGGAFLAALWIDGERLERRTDKLASFLQHVHDDLSAAKGGAPVDDPAEERKKRVTTFIKGLDVLPSGHLRSPLNPGSWWSRLDGRIYDAVRAGYRRILIDNFHADLEDRARTLTRPYEAPPSNDAFPPSIEKSREFDRLKSWLGDLAAFEANVARYDTLIEDLHSEAPAAQTAAKEEDNREGDKPPADKPRAEEESLAISSAERAKNAANLADYLYGPKTSAPIEAEYYEVALSRGIGGPTFVLTPYKEPAQSKAIALFKRLHERLLDVYSEGTVRADVKQLLKCLRELEAGGAEYTPDKLWELRDAIELVEADLATPALSWIPTDDLPPNPGIPELLQRVRASRLLGPGLEQSLRDEGNSKLIELRTDLENAGTPLSGPLLDRKDRVVQMKLSPFVVGLKSPIDALRQQSFMTAEEDTVLAPELNDARVSWDLDVLKEASERPKEYEAFQQGAPLKPLEPRVRNTLGELATRQLKASTLGAVARAARTSAPGPAAAERLFENLRGDVGNLGQASIPIRGMISTFGRLHMDDARDRLRELLRAQGSRLLTLGGQLLGRDPLYVIKDDSFSWWEGNDTPAFEAFGVTDPARLGEYAVAQRTRAEALAKELAEPVLGVMESPEVAAEDGTVPAIAAWRRIVSPLHDFENKKIGNSVSKLESFVLSELPMITLENCLGELEKRSPGSTAGDFFASRHSHIYTRLHDQCKALAANQVRSDYGALRRTFNRDLAGKFPFVKVEPGIRVEDAQPEAVRRFLRHAGDFSARYRARLARRKDIQTSEVVRFLEKIDDANAFLKPLWAQVETAEEGIFDARVDFRVNQSREVGGNRIAEWSMRLADARLFLGGPKPEASWRVGDPVTVELRWAKNSMDVPAPTQGSGVTVDGRTVAFEERGAWALLRLIAFHQTVTEGQDPSGKGDAAAHLLSFIVQTIPDPTGGFVERVSAAEAATVRVFIRLGVMGVEKDKLLKYPEFPTSAPVLPSTLKL